MFSNINYSKEEYWTEHAWPPNTGAGFNEEEMGITLSEILESMCPFYEKMDAIFGYKANVESMDELNTTQGMICLDPSELDKNGLVVEESHRKLGLSAYESRQRQICKLNKYETTDFTQEENKIASVVQSSTSYNRKTQKFCINFWKGKKNLKENHPEEIQENFHLRLKLLEKLMSI
ncbi:hypothetical protein O181_015050 [Austropuccinia psidii MF-1]|uniref:Uncharacterized protein n=1 Tax=Austropuccinia psidii MF-1 TaxID=1389203 RepID=A0A9Q3C343_9BASI|nr:hypothetical protein [Austropuccinia psidii MF-1]